MLEYEGKFIFFVVDLGFGGVVVGVVCEGGVGVVERGDVGELCGVGDYSVCWLVDFWCGGRDCYGVERGW